MEGGSFSVGTLSSLTSLFVLQHAKEKYGWTPSSAGISESKAAAAAATFGKVCTRCPLPAIAPAWPKCLVAVCTPALIAQEEAICCAEPGCARPANGVPRGTVSAAALRLWQ